MNFKTMSQHMHKELCTKLGVPEHWIHLKLEHVPYSEYADWLSKIPIECSKFISVEFDSKWNTVVMAEFLVAPEYASLA